MTAEVVDRSPDATPSDTSGAGGGGKFHPQRPEFQAIADRLYRGENMYLGHGQIERLRQDLEDTGLSITRRLELMTRLALQHL